MAQTKAQLIDGKGAVDLGALSISGSAPDNSVNLDSSGRLLVGTSSNTTTAKAEFYNTGTYGVAYQPTVFITNNSSGGATNQNTGLGAIVWATDSNASPVCSIEGIRENPSTGASSSLVFRTGNSSGGTERMRIDSTGNLIIKGSSGDVLNTSSYSLQFGNTTGVSYSQINTLLEGSGGVNGFGGALRFFTKADNASSQSERMRITNGGYTLFYNSPGVAPNTDNAVPLGILSQRWSAVYAVNGTIQTSDERTKTNVATSSLGSDFIKSLRPVSYKWIEGGNQDTGERDKNGNYIYKPVPGKRTHWGFIAQEVKQAVDVAGVDFGGWVLTDKDDPESQQALRYDQFIAPLTKALQEALHQIDELKAEVNELKAKLP